MTRVLTFAAVLLTLCSCSAGSRSLGHGYRLVLRTVDMRHVPDAFEGLAHYTDLYYRSHRLGSIGAYSISPSGRYALFQDGGRTLIFDRASRQSRDVTDGRFAIAKSFAWSEESGVVQVEYYDGHLPSRIDL